MTILQASKYRFMHACTKRYIHMVQFHTNYFKKTIPLLLDYSLILSTMPSSAKMVASLNNTTYRPVILEIILYALKTASYV